MVLSTPLLSEGFLTSVAVEGLGLKVLGFERHRHIFCISC